MSPGLRQVRVQLKRPLETYASAVDLPERLLRQSQVHVSKRIGPVDGDRLFQARDGTRGVAASQLRKSQIVVSPPIGRLERNRGAQHVDGFCGRSIRQQCLCKLTQDAGIGRAQLREPAPEGDGLTRAAGTGIDFRERSQRSGILRRAAQEPHDLAFCLQVFAAVPQLHDARQISHDAGTPV
jgi:hypothetical protein